MTRGDFARTLAIGAAGLTYSTARRTGLAIHRANVRRIYRNPTPKD